jgi:hypothetical protein
MWAALVAGSAVALVSGLRTVVVVQSVNESRTVADMVENIGRWASQYGGVHVRTAGTQGGIPGSFLTRTVYAGSDGDASLLQGTRTDGAEREALARLEAYHWKNPALVQREVADVVAASGSLARFRMTARTVMNKDNAPRPWEVQALDAIQARMAGGAAAAPAARAARPLGTPAADEHWEVQGGELRYARAMVAQASCLRCHESAAKAPAFLREHAQFGGGGGYGYVAGQPAGLIVVSLPLPSPTALALQSLPPSAWAAMAVAALAALGLLLTRRRR